MNRRNLLLISVLTIAAVMLIKPGISLAAGGPAAALAEAAPPAQNQPAADPTGPDAQQLLQTCLDAHNLPTPEQRAEAMNKLMNDPSLAGAMGQMMSDPKFAAQMGEFMRSPAGRSAMGQMMNGSGTTTIGSSGCH